MLRLPPLGAIEAFIAVARYGSIKAAAEALALSASALSRRIQTLETWLGEPLFERRHQALVLTAEGERLQETAGPLIDDLARLFATMGGPGELRVRAGIMPLFASHVLMPRLGELREKHPDLHLDIDTAPTPMNRLGDGLDVAIWLAQDIDPRLYARKIAPNRIVVVMSKELRDQGKGPQTPAELKNYTVLVHRDMPLVINHWFEGQGLPVVRPADVIQFDSGQLILDAAASGLGIAFMLDTLLQEEPRLTPVFNTFVDSPFDYWFVCRQAALSSKAVRLFHDWLFAHFSNDATHQNNNRLK